MEKTIEGINNENKNILLSKKKPTELYSDLGECIMEFLGYKLNNSWENFIVFSIPTILKGIYK